MDDAKENNQTMLTTLIRFEPNMCGWYHIVSDIPQCTERALSPHWSIEGTNGQSDQPWDLANSLVTFWDYELFTMAARKLQGDTVSSSAIPYTYQPSPP
jgi:hypothetical protein